MNLTTRLTYGAAVAVLAGALSPATVQAQSADEADERRLGSVTVTAQRREENLQDVPIAITAFSEEDLVNLQITEPLDLADYVPNLVAQNNTGLGSGNVYFIRGLGNTESISTFDPPVGTYVDDIYIARQNANNVAFYDVEGVEILRGPQGTLFGRNTTGGAVIVRAKKPSEEFGGFLEAEYGSFDRVVVRGTVDLPVTDQILTKVSGFFVDDNGFVDNTVTGETLNGQDAFGFRADLRFLLSDSVTFDFTGEYTEDNGLNIVNAVEGQGGVTVQPTGGGNRISQTGLTSVSNDGTPLERALAGEGLGNFNDVYSFSSKLTADVGPGTLEVIGSFRSLEQIFTIDFFDGGLGGQGFPTGGFTIGNDGSHDQASAEIKYFASYFDGKLDVTSGFFYFYEDNSTAFADVFTLDVGPPNGFPLVLANRQLDNTLNSFAVYSQADYRPTDKLTLTVGLRWTQEEKDIAFTDLGGGLTSGTPASIDTANIAAAGIPLEQVTALVTPRFVIDYAHSDNLSVFASATNGFKSGGWNARGTSAGTLTAFDDETVWSYELGWRSEFWNNRIRFNGTAFFSDIDDAQTVSGVDTPAGVTFLTDNFADQQTYGLELEAQALVTDELRLFASLGLQESEFNQVADSVLAQQAACLASLAADDTTSCNAGIVTIDGTISDPVRTPPATLTLGGTYEYDIPALDAVLIPNVNLRFQIGDTFVATDNDPNSLEDGYVLVNAGMRLVSNSQGWSLSAECTNCTNSTFIQSDLAGALFINEPRRWALRIRKDF